MYDLFDIQRTNKKIQEGVTDRASQGMEVTTHSPPFACYRDATLLLSLSHSSRGGGRVACKAPGYKQNDLLAVHAHHLSIFL
jgi:hypothetical protein